jgi:hypothetical protein
MMREAASAVAAGRLKAIGSPTVAAASAPWKAWFLRIAPASDS